jgi:heme exporter protein D
MNLGPHAAFILTAYAAAIAIVGGLIAWIALDRWFLMNKLQELEAHGIRRRSERGSGDEP